MERERHYQFRDVIESVITPLNFIVFTFLMIETLLGSMAYAFEKQREILIWAIISLTMFLIFIVVAFVIWQPERLRGYRPWQENLAKQFADTLFLSLQGPMENLPKIDQEEAWMRLADVITNDEDTDPAYLKFCEVVGKQLKSISRITGEWKKSRGTLPTR
jgi:hypothetical protein